MAQIAAEFAADYITMASIDDGAAADSDTGADGLPAQEASKAVILSVERTGSRTDLAVRDNIETDDPTASQGRTGRADAETSPMEEAVTGDAPNGRSDGDGSHIVSDDHDATEPATTDAGVDNGIFRGFPAAPRQRGEFQLPLRDLVIGKTSDSGVYDFDAGAAESLCHAVKMPESVAPIVVMKAGDAWHVIDGWARVMAFRFQFGNTENLMVRVIEWDGTRNDALYNRFAATFLTLKSRKIDKSILLRQFHLAWSVPQLVLAARIGWLESRVTRELAAAEAMLEAPRFAELHVKAGDPPIDYLYKVQQARDDAAADDQAHPKRAAEKGAVAKLDAKLEALLAKPERFATAEALTKLGIGKPGKTAATVQASEPTDVPAALPTPELIDCVEDSGGDAVALVEMSPDQFPSIRLLVDATTLDDRRKAEVRHLVHEALDRLLGY